MILLLLSFLPFLFSFLEVPFVKQSRNFCGPASLSSVFGYYGKHIDQEEISKVVYSPKLKGALITDLQKYAESVGFETKLIQGSTQDIRRYIDNKIPVIILVDLGKFFVSVPHYIVVVGYHEDYFIVHTGYEPNKKIREDDLNRMWSKMGRVMLVIYPKTLQDRGYYK